jgi:hypothetical protein
MSATLAKTGTIKKEKVTVSVDAALLRVVDAFVEEAKTPGMSRSAIFEQALHLWKQEMRDFFDAKYYADNTAALAAGNQSWSAITTEASKHIWKE